MTVQELLALTKVVYEAGYRYKPTTPRIHCMDGSSLSVQASEFTYCSPRDDVGPYYSVEVGYPSRKFEELMPYAEDRDYPTETVYGYVPIDIVEEIVASCGGICIEMTFLAKDKVEA